MKKIDLFQATSFNEITPLPADTSRFGGSLSILLRWKKSVYKLLWRHILIYALCYISLSLLYEFVLEEKGKKNFQRIAEHCSAYSKSINLMIILGFFTSTAMQRLFTMQTNVPGTYKSITIFVLSLKQDLPEGPLIVEQFIRWQLLSWVLTFRLVCRPLQKIYPDLYSLQIAGLMTEEERLNMENAETLYNNAPRPLIVIEWLLLLLKETFLRERFFMDFNFLKNVEGLMVYKKSCGNTIKFASQNIPQAVIQAVILAVYCFGMVTLMARTFSKEEVTVPETIMAYIPIVPGIQFFIYFAWLCFGRAAVDPFGDDDNDIDVKQLVESHILDAYRLKRLYGRHLEDEFPNLPHKEFNTDSVEL